MNYDFDKVIDRTNTNSLKYDFAVERGRPADVLPLWVADMDFPPPAAGAGRPAEGRGPRHLWLQRGKNALPPGRGRPV